VSGVDVQDSYGCSTARSETYEPWAIPSEVTIPALPAGIEKHRDAPGQVVATAQVAGSGEVAVVTRPGEKLGIVGAAVFFGEDVIYVKGEQRRVALVEMAIFAALPGA